MSETGGGAFWHGVAATCLASLALAAPALAGGDGVNGSAGLGDALFPKAGNGGYHVDHYNVSLRYHRDGSIRAMATIKATADTDGGDPGIGPSLRRFNLDFRGPRITRLRVNAAGAGFGRQGAELIVTPQEPLVDGAEFRARVAYGGRPKPVTDPDGSREGWLRTGDGAVAVGEPLGTTSWLPCNNHPTDTARYRIRITTPAGLRGVSNGVLAGSGSGGRTQFTLWRQPKGMACYLATIAIGKFRFDRAAFADLRYLGALDPEYRDSRAQVRGRTRDAYEFLSGRLDGYPFGAIGAIVDPAPIPYALETQTRPYYPAPPSRALVLHEIAHQWFGNSVRLASWDQMWLNEGFATYVEWLYEEDSGGQSVAARFDEIYDAHGPGDGAFWNPPPGDIDDPEDLFATSVYQRGAMALQALREQVGDPDFFQTLLDWSQTHRYSSATIAEFIALAETTSGEELSPLFDEWLYQPGKP